jgi:hypothetical protein
VPNETVRFDCGASRSFEDVALYVLRPASWGNAVSSVADALPRLVNVNVSVLLVLVKTGDARQPPVSVTTSVAPDNAGEIAIMNKAKIYILGLDNVVIPLPLGRLFNAKDRYKNETEWS